MYLFIIPKENQTRKENRINIKSEKLNKRKEKLSVSKAFHNNLLNTCKYQIVYNEFSYKSIVVPQIGYKI